MAYRKLLVIAGLVLVSGSFLVYRLSTPGSEEPVVLEVERAVITISEPVLMPALPLAVPVRLEPEPVLEPAAVIVEAEEPPSEVVPAVETPALNNSDDFVRAQIANFQFGSDLLALLVPDELVRKFVLFTDSVSRGFSPRDVPLHALQGRFRVNRGIDDEHFVMAPASYERFDFLVDAVIAMDTEQAVSLYSLLSPLFQQAYAEIGYPEQNFNKVMLAAIDNVLSAPLIEEPLQLIRPAVVYLYADEDVESLTPVEKLLLRLGPDNADKLQQKLRSFRYRYMVK